MTHATLRLLEPLWRSARPLVLDYGEPLETPRYTLTLHPSGHMFGAAQALVVSKETGHRLLYTGDLKLQSNPTTDAVEAVPCDTLVLDATFGRPSYVFPPESEVLASMERVLRGWLEAGQSPVVLAYPKGKSQELLHHLLARGFRVAAEERIYEAARVYEEIGVAFPGEYRSLGDSPGPAAQDGEVLLVSTSARRNGLLDGVRRRRLMSLTGWSVHRNGHRRLGVDAALPFSDHADYNDLLEYVRRVSPKRVYTFGGFPELAKHLQRLGLDAYHMGKGGRSRQLPLI
jgi:Cft2 family RNA processing exonuclease